MGKPLADEVARARMRAAGVEPLEPYPGRAHAPWRCECQSCGSVVTPTMANVQRGQGPCRVCGRRQAGDALRLSEEEARDRMIVAGATPLEPYPGTNLRPWRCKCHSCGDVITPRLGSITGRVPCPRCGREAQMAARRADADDAAMILRAAGADPRVPYPGRLKPWRAQCVRCGRNVSPMLVNVMRGTRPCKWCANRARAKSNLTDAEVAREQMIEAGAVPLEPFRGVKKKWRCRCVTCGEEVWPQLQTIQRGAGPCTGCAVTGFDQTAPALVYLVELPAASIMKVGVMGTRTYRLKQHTARGWIVAERWEVATGKQALDIERAVIAWWGSVGATPAERHAVPAGDGYTEAVHVGRVDTADTQAFIATLLAKVRTACEPDPPNSPSP